MHVITETIYISLLGLHLDYRVDTHWTLNTQRFTLISTHNTQHITHNT